MESSWTVTKASQRAVANGLWLASYASVAMWLVYAWVVLLVAGVELAEDASLPLTLGIEVGGVVLVTVLLRWGIGRQVRKLYPVGFTARSVVTDDCLRATSSIATTELPWTSLRKPTVHPRVVMFRSPIRKLSRLGLPRELVPDEAIARMIR